MEDHFAPITFYIPSDLEESVPRAASTFAALETLVARGNVTRSSFRGDAQLLALFGGDPADGSARAAVSHRAQCGSGDAEQWRIIASPVHLVADHATLHFPPQPDVLLSDEESRALMASCQEHFAGEGWQLEYGDANTWYLRVSDSTRITTTPVDEAIGKPIFESLPQGEDARIWRRWTNEVQMLLHSHAVNEARRLRGAPSVNSLWFWGEGHLPELNAKRFNDVFGGDNYVQGLAKLSSAQWLPMPKDFTALKASAMQGPILVVLDAATRSSWERDGFHPLLNTLRARSVSNVVLHFRNGYTAQLKPSMLWRFWRRKRLSISSMEP